MPAPSDEPLRRCHIWLYESDVKWLARRYGHGWSEHVRRATRNLVRESQPVEIKGLLSSIEGREE